MSRLRLFLSLGLVLCVAPSPSALAQKGKKAPAAAPAAPAGPTPEQQQAVAEFTKGQELQKAGDLDGAIAQYEKAFALYADPEIQFVLGEVRREKGDRDADFSQYEVAITHYRKYLEMAPEGRAAAAANQRINALEQGLANKKAADERDAADAKRVAEEAAREKREAEEAERRKAAARAGTQYALDISLTAGSEPDLTGIGRLLAGGMIGWGRFALEGHLGFGGFLRTADAGVAARELTLLDLGARYSFTNDRFVGPFIATGGSFGLIFGKPRERKLADDAGGCGAFTGECAYAIDKDLTGRLALGYGFSSGPDTTMAVRLDFTYFMFSVDGDQELGSPPAAQVEKPSGMFGLLIGLEFMNWR